MEHATEGIILASIPYEESFIVDVFTKEYGRIAFVAKRQKKQKILALSALLAVELLVIPSEKEFWKCREFLVCTSFPRLRTSRNCLMHAALMAHLLTKILPRKEPHKTCFLAFRMFLEMLPFYRSPETASCVFLAKLCYLEGLFPGNDLTQTQKQQSIQFIKEPFERHKDVFSEEGLFEKLEKLAKGGT